MLEIKRKTILFLSVIALTIAASIWSNQYVISIQRNNEEIVNVFHKLNMLSQRIAKLIFLIDNNSLSDSIARQATDSLSKLLPRWREHHQWLLTSNLSYTGSNSVTQECDSLLKQCSPKLEAILAAAKNFLAVPNATTRQNAVQVAIRHELNYHILINHCVEVYEEEENNLLSVVYFLPFGLGIFVFLILVMGYLVFVNPLLVGFRKGNAKLVDVNSMLAAKTNEIYQRLIEIKSLQEDLRAGEKKYRELVENVSDIIYELDENGKFSFINKEAERITGYSRDEFLAKHFWDLFPPDQSQVLIEDILILMKSRQATAYRELPILTKSKSVIWIGQNIAFQHAENNRLAKVKVVARDITRIKEAEQKLKDGEALYRLLSENTSDIICLHEATDDANYIYVSPSIKQVLGYEPEELIGKSPFSIILDEHAKTIKYDAYKKALQGKETSSIEFRMRRKDGSVVWLESWSRSIFDKDGKVTSFQTSTRDISLHKEIEDQLKRAKALAEEAVRAKSNFLSVMSHEIRTPLNGVIGLAQLLMQEKPRADQLERIRLLKFSADNLLSLINDILDFNKLESGKLKLESVEFSLKDNLTLLIETFQLKAKEKSISLNLNTEEDVPDWVIGDPTRLNQIIANLVSNALKFTHEGSVTVRVEKGKRKDEYKLSVIDTGIGIPLEMQPKIFESFTQADLSTTRKYGGSGLGLSISRQLIELMGGTINILSEEGEGSTFSFTILLSAIAKNRPLEQGRKKSARFSKQYSVLVVDDDRINQLVATQFLAKWNLKATVASSGKQALELIDKEHFDLILMDIQMPEMNGFQTTQAIRGNVSKRSKQVPILAMTAAYEEEILTEAKTAGINGYISKPFNADEFFKSLYEALEPTNQN